MMKRVLFLSLLVFLTSYQLIAQPKTDQPAEIEETDPIATKIKFVEMEYDFGVIDEGTIVTHVYTFTNTGDEPLILLDAKGSCGCTVPQWPRQPIAPGETASLTVEFNSKNKSGMRNQKVTITANTEPPQNFLYLKGEVNNPDLKEEATFDFVKPEAKINKENANCFKVFPNPTAEVIKLEMSEYIGEKAVVGIYSDQGQLMAEKTIQVEGIVKFQVNHYPAGIYYARFQIEGQKPEARCFMVTH